MPVHIFECNNRECSLYSVSFELYIKNNSIEPLCEECNSVLYRKFPVQLHVKDSGKNIDGKDIGKVTQEKNESLKKKHSGYQYEEQNLRQKMTQVAEEKLKK